MELWAQILAYGVLGVCVLVILFAMLMLGRNERVYCMRINMLDRILELNSADFARGKMDSWSGRYLAMEKVSYNTMMWPWKRLKASSYYDNLDFLGGEDVSAKRRS